MIPVFLGALAIAAFAMSTGQPSATHDHTFDVAHSTMIVYVFKQGIFSFAADNHEVSAPIASGSFDDASMAVQVKVDAAKMLVLDPKLPANRRAQVQANMVGPQVLDAAHYPSIDFQSTKISVGTGNEWTVTGDLTLHGQTHPVTFQVTKIDALHFRGAALVRQTEFGITPIRIAGGTVSVKDDVKIAFDIALSK
jgi:polyisoprenoid-binding protein YceI